MNDIPNVFCYSNAKQYKGGEEMDTKSTEFEELEKKAIFKISKKFNNSFFIIISLIFIAIVIGLFINSYFVHKEILYASNMCYENNGFPIVERGFMSLSWAVTCK